MNDSCVRLGIRFIDLMHQQLRTLRVVVPDVTDEQMLLIIDRDVLPIRDDNAADKKLSSLCAIAGHGEERLLLRSAAVRMRPKDARKLPARHDAGAFGDARVSDAPDLTNPRRDFPSRQRSLLRGTTRRQHRPCGDQPGGKFGLARLHFGVWLRTVVTVMVIARTKYSTTSAPE